MNCKSWPRNVTVIWSEYLDSDVVVTTELKSHSCDESKGPVTAVPIQQRTVNFEIYSSYSRKDLPKQNQSFIVFGMFVLWFSWYAFNAGPAILAGRLTLTTSCSWITFLLGSLFWCLKWLIFD